MPLAAGSKFGPYEILESIGAGGMGVVYRALDTKLNRPVAIKVLSGDVGDIDARRRFQREAQLASSLNHPHIVTVYDVGEIEGLQYIVTEFVDGGTLKDWAGRLEPTTLRLTDTFELNEPSIVRNEEPTPSRSARQFLSPGIDLACSQEFCF